MNIILFVFSTFFLMNQVLADNSCDNGKKLENVKLNLYGVKNCIFQVCRSIEKHRTPYTGTGKFKISCDLQGFREGIHFETGEIQLSKGIVQQAEIIASKDDQIVSEIPGDPFNGHLDIDGFVLNFKENFTAIQVTKKTGGYTYILQDQPSSKESSNPEEHKILVREIETNNNHLPIKEWSIKKDDFDIPQIIRDYRTEELTDSGCKVTNAGRSRFYYNDKTGELLFQLLSSGGKFHYYWANGEPWKKMNFKPFTDEDITHFPVANALLLNACIYRANTASHLREF